MDPQRGLFKKRFGRGEYQEYRHHGVKGIFLLAWRKSGEIPRKKTRKVAKRSTTRDMLSGSKLRRRR